jgi:hypothetical protein
MKIMGYWGEFWKGSPLEDDQSLDLGYSEKSMMQAVNWSDIVDGHMLRQSHEKSGHEVKPGLCTDLLVFTKENLS